MEAGVRLDGVGIGVEGAAAFGEDGIDLVEGGDEVPAG